MPTNTARLLLQKPNPDPLTGDFLDVSVLNSNFDKLDAAIGAAPVTAATRPASPFHGQLIRETDTRRGYVWNATQSAWDQFPLAGSRFRTAFDVERDTIGQTFYNGYLTGEANPRFTVAGDGELRWSSGAAGADTVLARTGANVLSTGSDDQLIVRGGTHKLCTWIADQAATSALALTSAAFVDIAGTTITFTTYRPNANLAIWWTNDFDLVAASGTGLVAHGICNVDGVDQSPNTVHEPGNVTSGRATVGQHHRTVIATAGTHTVKLRAKMATGASGISSLATHTKLMIMVFE